MFNILNRWPNHRVPKPTKRCVVGPKLNFVQYFHKDCFYFLVILLEKEEETSLVNQMILPGDMCHFSTGTFSSFFLHSLSRIGSKTCYYIFHSTSMIQALQIINSRFLTFAFYDYVTLKWLFRVLLQIEAHSIIVVIRRHKLVNSTASYECGYVKKI